MCDYSLYTVANRLAEQGEELVLHRFTTGTLGFTSASDLLEAERVIQTGPETFWGRIKHWLLGPGATSVPAVCVPPGARLLLTELSRKVQTSLRVGPSEIVVFTEISDSSYSYRDAVLLPNGTRVLLQDLPEDLHAVVLSTSSEPAQRPVHEELSAA
jgi:hypothetical protein